MKPIIHQNISFFIGYLRGVAYASFLGTGLLYIAHRINPACPWQLPASFLALGVAAWVGQSILYDKAVKEIEDSTAKLLFPDE